MALGSITEVKAQKGEKNKSLTADGSLFFLPNFSGVSWVASTAEAKIRTRSGQQCGFVALTHAAKGPQLRWPAKRAKSSGNQAGGALGNGRAGPRQGAGRASPHSDSGQFNFPLVRPARNCSNPSRAAQKKQPTDRRSAHQFGLLKASDWLVN